MFRKILNLSNIDWFVFFALMLIVGAGLVTMNSFLGESAFYSKQLSWLMISLIFFFLPVS
jgi:hypothetical protein